MLKKLTGLFALLIVATTLWAQEISYGFHVGLNFNRFSGPSEVAADGSDLERYDGATGFQVGADFLYKFTDLVGIRSGLTFFQRGTDYIYSGQGIQFFPTESGQLILANGQRDVIMTITNSYLDIPLNVYYKIGGRVEIYGGAHISFMVGSTGEGDFRFNGTSSVNGNPIMVPSVFMDHNYFKDDVPTPAELASFTNVLEIEADGQTILVPELLSAYYDFGEKDKSFYNFFDVGLQAGLNIYINQGLYVGGALNYGLLDVTRSTYDVSRTETSNGQYIERDDIDHNFNIEMKLGFNF